MKKVLIIVGLITICYIAQSYANDCKIFEGDIEKTYAGKQEYRQFLDENAFQKAIIHLKAYCCKHHIKCTDNLPEKHYPQSAFLFDHLVDVSMRRLDGIKELAYGLDPDPMAKTRREEINKIAADPTGQQAVGIQELLNNYRPKEDKKKTQRTNTIVLPKYNTSNTEELSLTDKYATLCEINKIIYQDLVVTQAVPLGRYSDTSSFYRKCINLTRARVQSEIQYVKLLMVQKSSQMLDTTTKAYTKTYFGQEKLMGLRTLITKVKNLFQTIVKQAPAAKKCN